MALRAGRSTLIDARFTPYIPAPPSGEDADSGGGASLAGFPGSVIGGDGPRPPTPSDAY